VIFELLLGFAAGASAAPDFNREVRPILSENCFHCHGQDAKHREADLRLDTAGGATETRDGAGPAVVPGDREASELWRRITSREDDDLMPPPDSHRSLTPEEIETLGRWIDAGAEVARHWAFQTPTRPAPPDAGEWAREPWDGFVHRRLRERGLEPAPETDAATWLRRASLDLTGLAPTPEQLDAFERAVARDGEAAYAAAVERLLDSPRFGEHLASAWLDIARYADTHGFNNDSSREMWRWRDWVIEAFNDNLPYDRFLTRQLAGDLLPDADFDSRLATGFNRNHVINSEGGIIEEEYRVEYVADRVRTVGTAWLGLTLDCARCHDHKYDAISQRDYYSLFAFFNQVPELGEAGRWANAAPLMLAPTRAQQARHQRLGKRLAEAEAALARIPSQHLVEQPAPAAGNTGKARPLHAGLLELDGTSSPGPAEPAPEWRPNTQKPWSFATWLRWDGGEGVVFSSIDYTGDPASGEFGKGVELRVRATGELELRLSSRWPAYSVVVVGEQPLVRGRWHALAVTSGKGRSAAARRVFVDFRELSLIRERDGQTGNTQGGPLRLGACGEPDRPAVFDGAIDHPHGWNLVLPPDDLDAWLERTHEAARHPRPDLAAERRRARHEPDFRETLERVRQLHAERAKSLREMPTVMVMEELDEPRPTFVLDRGAYDQPSEPVEPAALEELLLPWPDDAPRNRLGLARWLTDPAHPLTARVVVNRIWQRLFGTGLVKTVEDFGVQGEFPSHPELLDFLAREFIDSGWDLKALHRSLVLSATYRQDSTIEPEASERDPENRLLGRGPRQRMSAEMLRDHALHVSGLLHHRLGGPSVRPFQPENLYKGVVVNADYPSTKWRVSKGEDRFRRSLYTFWKRTVPHPLLLGFDMPDREFCVARRSATNTPLQALALLNETSFLHAAGQLGQRLAERDDPDAALIRGFRFATGRVPDATELDSLRGSLGAFREDWREDPEASHEFLASCGIAELPDEADPAELAAHVTLASLLLNLDETIVKK